MAEIRVSSAYQGIPGIAHGGYVAGLLAEQAGEPLQVTLRRPPPLDTPLAIDDGDGLALRDPQGRLVMEAVPAVAVERELPTVALDEARARDRHPRFAQHPYPVCFVCGTQHDDGFGMRVSAPDERGVAAAVWLPSGPLLPDGDAVPSAFAWAVVDCLTVWSFADRWADPQWWPAVTGQLRVTTDAPVRRDAPHVASGRLVGRDRRRVTVDAVVADADGQVCARAEAVWVVIPETPAPP
jgi:hypothetical protein